MCVGVILCMHTWVDGVIGPVNVPGLCSDTTVSLQCSSVLSCGGVGKPSEWTSEGIEEE